MDKKIIFWIGGALLAIVILIVVVILTGKGSTVIKNSPKNTALTVWDYNNEKSAYDGIITEFQRQNNIKVNYVTKPSASYLTDTIDAIAAQNGPDVWIVPNDIMPQFRDKLVAMPNGSLADAANKKDDVEVYSGVYPPIVATDNVFNNQIYGIPMSAETLRLFFNPNQLTAKLYDYRRTHPNDKSVDDFVLLFQNGPRDWDEFTRIVRFFTEKTGTDISFPVAAIGTSDNVTRATDLLTLMMMQNGAKMTSDDNSTAQFHTQQNLFSNIDYPGTKAIEFYTSFANPKSDNYTWKSTMTDSIRAFAEGKVAMMFDYPSAKSKISTIAPNFSYAVMDVPQVKETTNTVNFARYDTLTVPKSSKISNMAWKFILFATDGRNSSNYYSVTKKPTVQNLQDTANPLMTAKDWFNPNTVKVEQIFKTAIQQVNDGKDAQTALDGAAGQITTLLGKLKQ